MSAEKTFAVLTLQITVDTARANRDALDEDDDQHADPKQQARIADTIIRGIAGMIDEDENTPFRPQEVLTRLNAGSMDGIERGHDGKIVIGQREGRFSGDRTIQQLLVELYEAVNYLPGVTARLDRNHQRTYYGRSKFGRRLTDEIFPDLEVGP